VASSRASEKDRVLTQELNQYVSESRDFVRPFHDEWDDLIAYYQGIQTKDLDGAELDIPEDLRRDWCPVNFIWSHTETKVAILADSAPLWYAISPDGSHEEDAETLTQALQAMWIERNISRHYKMSLRDQVVCGTGALQCWWNPTLGPTSWEQDGRGKWRKQALGDVDVSWRDIFSIYPDPYGTTVDACEYILFANDMAPERAKRLYPGFTPEGSELVSDNTENNWQGSMDRAYAWVPGSTMPANTQREMVRVWEAYHEGGQRLTIFSGDRVLFDGDNPTPGSKYPLALFPTYERGFGLFGLSEVSQVRPQQMAYNKMLFRILVNARLMGNTPWVVTGGRAPEIRNVPGEVISVPDPGAVVRREPPPPLPPHMFAMLQTLQLNIDTLTGMHDVTRGLKPGSVTSGVGIQQLQESAHTRPREMSRANEEALQRLGQLVLEWMQVGYEGPRHMAYMQGSEPVRRTVEPRMLREDLSGVESLTPDGEEVPAEGPVEEPIEYRVKVEPGGDLPMNAMAKAELSLRLAGVQLADGPAIDRIALLEAVKFPHRREVVERINQANAAMMQGQMQAQNDQAMQQQAMMQQQAAMQGGAAPGGAPGQPGAEGQPQDPTAEIEAIMAQLQQALAPEDLQVLGEILDALAQGGQLTPDQMAWLESLDPQVQELVQLLVDLITQAAEQEGLLGPEGGMAGANPLTSAASPPGAPGLNG
jgi:hypothetical protein